MSDYINRDGLAEHKFQESELRGMGEGQAYRQGWNDAIDAIIDNEPSADAVEVVRCRDCKHGRPYIHTKEYVACEVDCEPIDRDSDFFCADGERKTDE